jgi:hypothetical protein
LVTVWSLSSFTRGDKTLKPTNHNRNHRSPNEAEEKDMLELDRIKAVVNLEKYQEETRAWRNLKVKLREYKAGNLVLLRSPRTESTGKFEAKWIGPYVVTEKMRFGAYRLSDTQGQVLEHSWNAESLLHFYI